jgi:uncharacterized membrane protein
VSELALFLGRFHPALVHFPIVLLLLAAALELRAWYRSRPPRAPRGGGASAAPDSAPPPVGWSNAGRDDGRTAILAASALAALIAAGAGLLLGGSGGYGGRTFDWHQRFGVLVAFGAVLTLVAWIAARRSPRSATTLVYRSLLCATAILLIVAGHLGATLTHGEGYITEHAPAPLRGLLSQVFGSANSAPRAVRPDQAVAYATLVRPILEARCVKCHGADKAEGKLRLDTPAGIRKGGEDGSVIVPGRAADSNLVRRIWLPASHKDAMPPRGNQPVPASDAALIRWWVDQGASFDRKVSELDIAPDIQPAIEAMIGPLEPGGPTLPAVTVGAPDRQAVAAATRLGVTVVPLANSVNFVELHCTNAAVRFGDDQLEALRPLAPQTVWLDLSGTSISDTGLSTVAQFKNLTRLHLNRTKVSDAGLKQLAGLQHLEYLNLYGTGVTDSGVQSLTSLKKLRTLYVWQTAVTPNGLERLRSALPRLAVEAGLPLSSSRTQ